MTYIVYAALAAFCASLVAIFGKLGVKNIDSNLAVAIRTVIIVVFAWVIVLIQGNFSQIFRIPKYSWGFLILSALATGLSWLFYYRALQLGAVSKVAPIDKLSLALTIILAFLFLGEKPTLGSILGGGLVVSGVLVTAFVR
jgi:bacterial/archaeal transporter family protein